MSNQQKPSSEGRLFAVLSYLLPIIGGLIGLAINKSNNLTRNHAQQTIGAMLTLLLGMIAWIVVGYIISMVPAIRPIVIALTYILIAVTFVASLYRLATAVLLPKIKARGTKRLMWVAGIYIVGGIIYYLSQTNPDIVAFAVPVINLLAPVSELFMPVLLLITVIVLGAGILPTRLSQLLSIFIAINMLTWMPLAGPVIATALFALVIALTLFIAINWVFGLINAIRGKEIEIPIATRITRRMFGDVRKPKNATA